MYTRRILINDVEGKRFAVREQMAAQNMRFLKIRSPMDLDNAGYIESIMSSNDTLTATISFFSFFFFVVFDVSIFALKYIQSLLTFLSSIFNYSIEETVVPFNS